MTDRDDEIRRQVQERVAREAVPNISLRWIYYLKKQVNP